MGAEDEKSVLKLWTFDDGGSHEELKSYGTRTITMEGLEAFRDRLRVINSDRKFEEVK